MPFDANGKYVVGQLSFNPRDFLVKVKGSSSPNYLEVKYRLIMLREMFPEAVHKTEVQYFGKDEDAFAVVHCSITLPNGAHGEGYKMEERKHFQDYLEKAETGACGRALYAVGIGIQYSSVEYDYEADSKKDFVGVDTPLKVIINKEDLLGELAKEGERLTPARLAAQSQKMFKTSQSSKLTGEQLEALLAWAKTQS